MVPLFFRTPCRMRTLYITYIYIHLDILIDFRKRHPRQRLSQILKTSISGRVVLRTGSSMVSQQGNILHSHPTTPTRYPSLSVSSSRWKHCFSHNRHVQAAFSIGKTLIGSKIKLQTFKLVTGIYISVQLEFLKYLCHNIFEFAQ